MANNSYWILEALSIAAKEHKKLVFVLKPGENTIGKMKNSDIKIPSVLCSRQHCTIFVDGEKVTLKDTSSNGTYITFVEGTKHYQQTTADRPLGNNDMISIGFNSGIVYDVHDKNAYIYRLVKQTMQTIDILDSDEDDASQQIGPIPSTSSASQPKIISIDSKVIDIDSDSDSNYSGSECIKDIDEFDDENPSSYYDEDNSRTDFGSDMDSESIGSGHMVVTKTIIKCATPSETITLDDETSKDEVDDESEQLNLSKESNGDIENKSPVYEEDLTHSHSDDDVKPEIQVKPEIEKEDSSSSDTKDVKVIKSDIKSSDSDTTDSYDSKRTKSSKISTDSDIYNVPSTSAGTNKNELEDRLEKIKHRLKIKATQPTSKKIPLIIPKRIRKRRKTLTEADYNEQKRQKQEHKDQRRIQLHEMGNKQKLARETAEEMADEVNRTTPMPKIKCLVSRGEQLLTDMMACDYSKTSTNTNPGDNSYN